MKSKFVRVLGIGFGVLAAGCVSDAVLTASIGPEKGTMEYFMRRLQGKYALDGDSLVPVRGEAPPLQGSASAARWVEGSVLEAREDGLLVLGRATTNAVGTVEFRRECLLATLPGQPVRPTHAGLRVLAVADFLLVSPSGTLPGLRAVTELSYEAYRLQHERADPGDGLPDGGFGPPDAEWNVMAEESFRRPQETPVRQALVDPGLAWSVKRGYGRFKGKSTDAEWGENAVILPVSGDDREWLELTADFTVTSDPAQLIVELQGKGDQPEAGIAPLAVQYAAWRDRPSRYRLSTDWLLVPHRVEANAVFDAAFGDEAANPHRLRIVMDRRTRRIHYFADNRWLGMVMLDGEVGPVTQLRFKVDTPDSAVRVDCRVYNLRVRAAGNPYVFGVSDKSDEGQQRSSPTPGSVALEIPFTFTTNNNTITITKYIGPGGYDMILDGIGARLVAGPVGAVTRGSTTRTQEERHHERNTEAFDYTGAGTWSRAGRA